jgi:hypothetical protein
LAGRRDARVSQDFGEQFGTNAFAVVHGENECTAVGVHEKSIASTTATLAKPRTLER